MEVRLQRGLPCREGGARADSRKKAIFLHGANVENGREQRSPVLGPGKDAGKTQPPGREPARTRGLPGPWPCLPAPWPTWYWLRRGWPGRAPARFLLSPQPLRGPPSSPAPPPPPPPHLLRDRVDRQSRFPLQPPRPAASPGLRPALTWASQVTSLSGIGEPELPASFPGRELGPGFGIVWGSSAVSNCRSLSPHDVPATSSSVTITTPKVTFRFESMWSGARLSSVSALPLTAYYRLGSPEKTLGCNTSERKGEEQDWAERAVKTQGRVTEPQPGEGAP